MSVACACVTILLLKSELILKKNSLANRLLRGNKYSQINWLKLVNILFGCCLCIAAFYKHVF